ncbi:MAG: hypothetical protein U0Q55_18355 [Vicinamibacterales bacterium]
MFFDQLVTELSTTLSVGSLLFFVAVYLVVSIRAFRHGVDDLDARARMALNDGTEGTREQTALHG